MYGIITANFKDNLWPQDMAVTGTMDMVLKDGSVKKLDDTFYWIIVCMRNPYNGSGYSTAGYLLVNLDFF